MTVYDAETGEKITKKHRFTNFTIRKGSAVDRPAQEPAVAVLLMKHVDEGTTTGNPNDDSVDIRIAQAQKMVAAALTTADSGHTHLLDMNDPSGFTSWEQFGSEGEGHSHPFIVDGGVATIGEIAGHSHQVEAQASKSAGDSTNPGELMPDRTPEEIAAAEKSAERLTALEAENKTLKATASMTDAQKAHHSTLTGDDATAFLEADAEKRTAIVEAAKAADAIVYTSKRTGDVFHASDDPRLVKMAKRDDEREVELAKTKADAEVEVYKRRTKEEIPHLTGEESTQVALLKAIDTIEDEDVRGKVLEIVKASDASVGAAFKRAGVNGQVDGDNADTKLNSMANAYAEKNSVTFEKAFSEVTKTAEGAKLLSESFADTPAGSPE
ncbi:MAG: hypothetical protein DRJ50_10730 [Actinobacteria bacterium]|nr:MAG: hypothetical protein DRJ50_10730 [Actinomycetota bacterium]